MLVVQVATVAMQEAVAMGVVVTNCCNEHKMQPNPNSIIHHTKRARFSFELSSIYMLKFNS